VSHMVGSEELDHDQQHCSAMLKR